MTLRNIRSGLSLTVERRLEQDYRMSLACIAGHDFIEAFAPRSSTRTASRNGGRTGLQV